MTGSVFSTVGGAVAPGSAAIFGEGSGVAGGDGLGRLPINQYGRSSFGLMIPQLDLDSSDAHGVRDRGRHARFLPDPEATTFSALFEGEPSFADTAFAVSLGSPCRCDGSSISLAAGLEGEGDFEIDIPSFSTPEIGGSALFGLLVVGSIGILLSSLR